MTTRDAAAGGLSTADIDRIRSSLAAARRPTVVFTSAAGQVAGQTGQVVKLTDPEQSDDWLVVRFGRDELPFSPADLSIPARGRAGKKAATAPDALRKAGSGAVGKAALARKASAGRNRGTAAPDRAGSVDRPAPAGAASPPPGAAAPAVPAVPAVPTPRSGDAPARPPAKRATRTARGARSRPPAALTVTLAYQAGEWTVAAHQGSKTLAKPYLVRPAEALKMVSMLDVPGVHDAVEQIVTAELDDAQRRADTLRSELAEVEARLADLRDVS